jgi:hypothetical protein
MQPDKYIRDLESSRKRGRFAKKLVLGASFIFSMIILGPLIHEVAHIAVLEFYNCFHQVDTGFTLLRGLNAEIAPLCNMESAQLLFFYSAGYISTLVTASILSMAALEKPRGAEYLSAIATGLFISVLLSVGSRGDIQNAVDVLGISRSYSLAAVLFIVTGVLLSTLKSLQLFLDLEREE